MPARRVFAWEPEEQWTPSEEREKKIEELSRELDESMDSNSGKGCLKAYLVKNEVWHIADIDYELRVDYRKYLKSTYSDSAVRSYLRGMDKAKLYAIRKHANTLKGKQEIAKNTDLIHELLFLPYHPNPAIAERYDCKVAIDKLVWDFRVNGSELCKRQLLEIIEDVVLRDIMLRECTMRLNGLKVVYQFCMQEHIEDLRYITQVQADKLEKYADTAYAKELAERELRECQKYLFCHAKNILWDSTVWYLERLHLEQYRVNPSNPVKKFSFMGIEKRENREILQEYMKYCLGVTHLAMSGIQAEFYRILAFVMWMEKETAMELKLASETEIKKYFQTIELKEASYFNDIVIAIYQLYEYLQTKEIIDRIPFRYEYYLKKEIHCHNNRSVEMEIYERILRELKNFPEIPRLILLHSMLIGLRISEVCTLKGDAYSWQGRDAWIQVYQMKMRTYKRVPIPDVLYKIMKRYLEKYHIGSEDYVFQNKRGGAYQYGSFKWQMKELHLGSKEFSDAVNLIKENREFSVNIGCEKVFGSITENELKEYASLVRYYSEKSKSDNKGKEIGFDLRKIQKNGEILKKYLSSISMNTLNTLLCFSEMSNSFLAVEHLEEVHDDIVSKAFDGTYLIRKLKQRNICLRILYGMKKCGQVTYAKQLSAALEQEGVELTL